MDFFRLIRNPRIMATLCVSAILVSVNWLGFIWAVNNGKALEASMGYFIMPIVMVLLGRIFLEEHLNRRQLLSLVLVCLGVLNILFTLNQLPWIALLLSVSFGFYSLVRKTVAVNSLAGLTMECLLLSPVAVIYLLYLGTQDQLVFGSRGLGLDLLLAASALMTALPLIFFTSAARRLRLGTVGLIQYINPTCQFMLAVFLFDEPFTRHHLHTFVLIWLGLAMFSLDSRQQMKRMAI
jgi:chloramphenicol-sensitive protein RarD